MVGTRKQKGNGESTFKARGEKKKKKKKKKGLPEKNLIVLLGT